MRSFYRVAICAKSILKASASRSLERIPCFRLGEVVPTLTGAMALASLSSLDPLRSCFLAGNFLATPPNCLQFAPSPLRVGQACFLTFRHGLSARSESIRLPRARTHTPPVALLRPSIHPFSLTDSNGRTRLNHHSGPPGSCGRSEIIAVPGWRTRSLA
jgi:hypothetical protein